MPFLLALGLGVVLVPAARWASLATGLVDRPRKPLGIHDRPVPVLGGAAVVVSTLVASALLGAGAGPWVAGAVAVSFAVGLVDDLRGLPAWARLAAQAGAGGLLAAGGLRVEPLGPLAVPAIVLMVPLLANAVNIMDGQDGLAGGLAAIAAAGISGLAGWRVDTVTGGLGLALAGALVAFLAWNLSSRIFLGDSGAYAVGTLLAAQAAPVGSDWPGLGAVVLCLGLFGFELLVTVARRARSGTPLTAGDRGHSYDLLAARLGRLASTLVFWAAGGAAAAVALLLAASGDG